MIVTSKATRSSTQWKISIAIAKASKDPRPFPQIEDNPILVESPYDPSPQDPSSPRVGQ